MSSPHNRIQLLPGAPRLRDGSAFRSTWAARCGSKASDPRHPSRTPEELPSGDRRWSPCDSADQWRIGETTPLGLLKDWIRIGSWSVDDFNHSMIGSWSVNHLISLMIGKWSVEMMSLTGSPFTWVPGPVIGVPMSSSWTWCGFSSFWHSKSAKTFTPLMPAHVAPPKCCSKWWFLKTHKNKWFIFKHEQ